MIYVIKIERNLPDHIDQTFSLQEKSSKIGGSVSNRCETREYTSQLLKIYGKY